MDRNTPYGGLASLMALQGRNGDTELVHMSKPEIASLNSLGKVTTNPDTGLPEAFNLRGMLPALAVTGATIASGGTLTPLMSMALAGGTSALVNKGDMSKAAFDAMLAGAGSYLSGATMGTETAGSIFGKEAASNVAKDTALAALPQDPSFAGQLAKGVAPASKVGIADMISHSTGIPSSAVKMGLAAIPTVALGGGNLFDQGQPEQIQPLERRVSPELSEGMIQPRHTDPLSAEDVQQAMEGSGLNFLHDGLAHEPASFHNPMPIRMPTRPQTDPIGGPMGFADGGSLGLMGLYDGDGSEFEGLVEQGTDGMADDVGFTVDNPNPAVANLSKDEYVLDAHTVAALGNGSSEAGADILDSFVEALRETVYEKGKQPLEVDGLAGLVSLVE